MKIVKNKVAAPFREAEFDIIYGEGISREGDLIDLGVAQNIVEKSGSWYSYKGERIGQGRENARQFLKDNPDIRQQVDTDLRKALGLVRKEPVPAPAGASGSTQARHRQRRPIALIVNPSWRTHSRGVRAASALLPPLVFKLCLQSRAQHKHRPSAGLLSIRRPNGERQTSG